MKLRMSCAAIVALGVFAGPASAADLGGNCCADLEERIAELEATTARKGNRKVSLTISGWVNEAVFFWDDGVERNIYVGTNSLEQSRFKLTGEAAIVPGWSAGYTLEIGSNSNRSAGFNQNDVNPNNNLNLRKSSWFLKSKDLGKLTVGLDGTSTYHLIDDADITATRNFSDFEAGAIALGAFSTRTNGALGPKWTDLMGGFNNFTPGQSGRRNVVRYDTPSFGGFAASAAWGEDDMWDMAASYAGEIGEFKLAARVGYGESTDSLTNKGNCIAGNGDCQWWGGGGTLQHTPTGLYLYGGYGAQSIDLTVLQAAAGVDDQSNTWVIQPGIETKLFPIGKTTFFGEYRRDEVGLANASDSADLDFWAAGIIQQVDAAAMQLYIIYRNSNGDFTAKGATTKTELDDLDMLITGAKVNF